MNVYATITGARARLQAAADGLRAAASGAVVERAAAKVQTQVDKVAHKFTSAHRLSGDADDSVDTTTAGGLIQLRTVGYLRFHADWLFRRGMPPFVISNALKIFTAELVAALAGEPSPLLVAEEGAELAAAVKSRAQFKKDTAVIARRIFAASPAGKAARSAKALATRAAKKAP